MRPPTLDALLDRYDPGEPTAPTQRTSGAPTLDALLDRYDPGEPRTSKPAPNPKRHEFAGPDIVGPLRPAGPWDSLIRSTAQKHGLNENVLRALVMQESTGNPKAHSPVGAMGLTQLMPGTAAALGVKDPWDPAQNLDGGARYLKQQLRKYGGDLQKALAAYNAGPGNVDKYGGVPPFRETQNYVRRIMGKLSPEDRGNPLRVMQAMGAPVAPPGAPTPAPTAKKPSRPLTTQQRYGSGIGGAMMAAREDEQALDARPAQAAPKLSPVAAVAAAAPRSLPASPKPRYPQQIAETPAEQAAALRAFRKSEGPAAPRGIPKSPNTPEGALAATLGGVGELFKSPPRATPATTAQARQSYEIGAGQLVAGRIYNPVTGDVIRPRNDTELFLAVLGGIFTPTGQMVGERVQTELRDAVRAGKLNPWPQFSPDPRIARAQHQEAQVARKRLDALTAPVIDRYLARLSAANLGQQGEGFYVPDPAQEAAEKAQALGNLYHALKPQVVIPLYEKKYGKLSALEKQVLMAELDQRALYALRTPQMRGAYVFDAVVTVLADRFGARMAGMLAGRVSGRLGSILASPVGRTAAEGAFAGGPQQVATRMYADPKATLPELGGEFLAGTVGGGIIGGAFGLAWKALGFHVPEAAPVRPEAPGQPITPELPGPAGRVPRGSEPGGSLRNRPRPEAPTPKLPEPGEKITYGGAGGTKVTRTVVSVDPKAGTVTVKGRTTPIPLKNVERGAPEASSPHVEPPAPKAPVEAAPVAPRVSPDAETPVPVPEAEPPKAPTFKEAGDRAREFARKRREALEEKARLEAEQKAQTPAVPESERPATLVAKPAEPEVATPSRTPRPPRTEPAAEIPAQPAAAKPTVRPAEHPATTAGRTVTVQVKGETRVATLSPEQAVEWDAAEAEYQSAKRRYQKILDQEARNPSPTPEHMDVGYESIEERARKNIHALGLRYSAEKRRIAGLLTEKEKAAADKVAASLTPGKSGTARVGSEDMPVTIIARPAFGRVKVRLPDGSEVTVGTAGVKVTGTGAPTSPPATTTPEAPPVPAPKPTTPKPEATPAPEIREEGLRADDGPGVYFEFTHPVSGWKQTHYVGAVGDAAALERGRAIVARNGGQLFEADESPLLNPDVTRRPIRSTREKQAESATTSVVKAPEAAAQVPKAASTDVGRQINNLKGEIAYLQIQSTDPKTSPRDVPALQREIAAKKQALAALEAQAKAAPASAAAPAARAEPARAVDLTTGKAMTPAGFKKAVENLGGPTRYRKAMLANVERGAKLGARDADLADLAARAKQNVAAVEDAFPEQFEAERAARLKAESDAAEREALAKKTSAQDPREGLKQDSGLTSEEEAALLDLGRTIYLDDGVTDPKKWREAVLKEWGPDADNLLDDLWAKVKYGRQAPPNPELGTASIRNRGDLETALKAHFGYSEADAKTNTDLFDARAQAWAAVTGRNPEEWYDTFLRGIGSANENRAAAEVQFDKQGRALILAFNQSNLSSAAHEFGHVYLHDLASLVDAGIEQAGKDLATFEKVAGLEAGDLSRLVKGYLGDTLGGEDIAKYRKAQELWASQFERFLRDGKAPTPALKNVFSRFKEWLRALYSRVKGTRLEQSISPEMRKVFNNLFAPPPEKPGGPRVEVAAGEGPSGQTGIANRLQDEQVARGEITQPKKAAPVDPKALAEWGYSQAKAKGPTGIYDFGTRIAAASDPLPWNPETAAEALGSVRVLKERRRDLLAEVSDAQAKGDVVTAESRLRDLEAEDARTQQFLDDIQKGKGRWAHTGWVMRQAWDDQTGDVVEMVRRARAIKGSDLTPAEKKEIEGIANAYDETRQALDKSDKQRHTPEAKAAAEELVATSRPRAPRKSKDRESVLSRLARALGLAQPPESAPPLRPYTPNLDDPVVGELAWDVLRNEGARDIDDLVKQVQTIVEKQGGKVEYDDVVDELVAFRRRDQKVREADELRRQQIMEEAREQERLRNAPITAKEKSRAAGAANTPRPVSQRTQDLRDAAEAVKAAERAQVAAQKAVERLKGDIAQLKKDLDAIGKGTYKAPAKPPEPVRGAEHQALLNEKNDLLKQKMKALRAAQRKQKVVDQEAVLRKRIADLEARAAAGDWGSPAKKKQLDELEGTIAALNARLQDLQTTRRLHRELADLEAKLEDPDYVPPTPKERAYTQEQEAMRARLRVLRAKMKQRLDGMRAEGWGEKLMKANAAWKAFALGGDVGVLLRQGGNFLVTQPKEYRLAFKRAIEAVKGGEDGALKVTTASESEVIRGKPLAQWERDAGLSLSQDTLSEMEEYAIGRLGFKKFRPGKKLDTFQVTFLNELRRAVFAEAVRSGMPPNELKLRASFINDLSGRGNIPKNLTGASTLANNIMTSFRYEVSRWSLALYQPAKNLGFLGHDLIRHRSLNRAAVANLRQMVVGPLIYLTGAVAAAQAFGWDIEMEPSQTGFFNLRVGDTVYDLSAGVSPRVRDLFRAGITLQKALAGRNQNWADLEKNVTVRSLSPTIKGGSEAISQGIQKARGESDITSVWSGFEQPDERIGIWNLAPLWVGGTHEGLVSGEPLPQTLVTTLAEILGAGASRYPTPRVWDAPYAPDAVKSRKHVQDYRDKIMQRVTPR